MIRVRSSSLEGHYDVEFRSFHETLSLVKGEDVVVTDSNLAQCYPDLAKLAVKLIVIPAGEGSKSFSVFESVVDQVVSAGLNRNGRIFGVGGGVVGDLAGFVAATVFRGVGFVQVPTSLLSMVDSSVGGKVGIDLPQGKNLLGAFKNPNSVEVSLDVLQTLPKEDFVNGMAEVIKYGWIWDSNLLEVLSSRRLTKESAELESVIMRCIEIKRDVVEADFEERSGLRAILNYGHTVGHALEALGGYRSLLHGQAIAIGMVAETAIARGLGLSDLEPKTVAESFHYYGLPVRPSERVDLNLLIDSMTGDKKNIGQGLSMSLVKVPGECKLEHGIDPDRVKSILADLWS
ncbi:MAG: 3-dehydroquinate synthase [Fimbriimonadaceae bacterium]